MQKTIALNESGRRIGESHPRAKLLDYEVEQVLELLGAGLSYAEVARKFDVSKSCIAHIAAARRRCQAVARTSTRSRGPGARGEQRCAESDSTATKEA